MGGIAALAADELSLDHRQGQPAVVKAHGDRFSGDATTEANDVKPLRHDPALRAVSKATLQRMLARRALVYQTLVSGSRRTNNEGVVDTFV
jgi:hypothetical protein